MPKPFFYAAYRIVLKDWCRVDRPYQAGQVGRSKHWVKVKTASIRKWMEFLE
jgi:hypothetical protein